MKVLAEVFKMPAFSQIWAGIAEFKLQIAIPFTIESIKKKTKIGLEPIDKFPFLSDTSIQHNQKYLYLILSEFLIVVVNWRANH